MVTAPSPAAAVNAHIVMQEVRDICASIDDKDAGANCAVALHQAASRRQAGAGPRLRFQVRLGNAAV